MNNLRKGVCIYSILCLSHLHSIRSGIYREEKWNDRQYLSYRKYNFQGNLGNLYRGVNRVYIQEKIHRHNRWVYRYIKGHFLLLNESKICIFLYHYLYNLYTDKNNIKNILYTHYYRYYYTLSTLINLYQNYFHNTQQCNNRQGLENRSLLYYEQHIWYNLTFLLGIQGIFLHIGPYISIPELDHRNLRCLSLELYWGSCLWLLGRRNYPCMLPLMQAIYSLDGSIVYCKGFRGNSIGPRRWFRRLLLCLLGWCLCRLSFGCWGCSCMQWFLSRCRIFCLIGFIGYLDLGLLWPILLMLLLSGLHCLRIC